MGRATELYPTDPEVLHWFAHAIWHDSVEEAERLLNIVGPYKPQQADVLYDRACARSIAEDLDASMDFLEQALAAGFQQWNLIEIDPDLRNVRQDPRYSELLREYGR